MSTSQLQTRTQLLAAAELNMSARTMRWLNNIFCRTSAAAPHHASRNEGQSSGVRLKGTETPHWLVIIVERFRANKVICTDQVISCYLLHYVSKFYLKMEWSLLATRFFLATQFLYGSPLHAYHPTSFLRSPRPILDVTILLRVATPVRGLRGGTMRAIPRHRTYLREGGLG